MLSVIKVAGGRNEIQACGLTLNCIPQLNRLTLKLLTLGKTAKIPRSTIKS